MRKLFVLFLLFIAPFLTFSQTVDEKMLADFSFLQNVESYSFYLDTVSGTYMYLNYDTLTKQSKLYSNKGNSSTYGNINYYNSIFDKEGNYFTIVSNNVTDTTYVYFILRNGVEIANYNNINMNWGEKNGAIYFVIYEDSNAYLVKYDISSGTFTKGKKYDEIYLCYYPYRDEEGEAEGQIGFTNDGTPYYIAKAGDEKFVVAGTTELKHYSDIDSYNFKLDNDGNFVYIAKSQGELFNAGYTFLVQGSKEYKAYDYVYGPILIDKSNNPIYLAGDSSNEYSPQRVVTGENENKTYKGGVYNLMLSPGGKLAYYATEYKSNGDYNSVVVLDGKESKQYFSINTIKFSNNDELLFTAGKDEETSCIVRGGKEVLVDFPTITDATILPNNKLAYICGKYGNYDKKIKDMFYLYMGDDEFGPYESLLPLNYTENLYVLYDRAGNYAYLASETIDSKNYVSHQILYTNNGESPGFDYIDNTVLYKGKPLYVGTLNFPNSRANTSIARVYYNNKPISPKYSGISNFQFNEGTGMASFIVMKNKAFYKVEIKM